MRHVPVRAVVMLGALSTTILIASNAFAIPAFARKYQVGCNLCHTIYPQLNRYGRDFRDNGFRTPDEIEQLLKKLPPAQPPKAEEDFWSFIPEQIPFSLQGKLHDAINPKGDVKSDFQIEEVQLQSGGTFTPRVSYYIHHHLVEEGNPGDLYTGWVRFNNLFGSDWLNLTVGQFELPLSFSPEIERLSSFEYLAYDRTLGGNGWALGTPQLGAQVFGQSHRGTKFWAGVVNGSGLAKNDTTGTFDTNNFKDAFLRVTQEVGDGFFGGYVYYGRASANPSNANPFDDNFVRTGADASVVAGKLILNGMVMFGRDDDPLGIGERRTFYGGFVEGDFFATDRTLVLLRVDDVHQSQPADFAVTEAGSEMGTSDTTDAFRINTWAVTPGVQWLVRPNVKLGFEYQVRRTREEDRALAELHLAF